MFGALAKNSHLAWVRDTPPAAHGRGLNFAEGQQVCVENGFGFFAFLTVYLAEADHGAQGLGVVAHGLRFLVDVLDLAADLFLLFLELAICFADSNMLILPIFSADWVSAGLNNDTLESLDPLTHLLV